MVLLVKGKLQLINVHVALFELHIVYTVRDLVVIKDKENAFAH